jgi:hypothetical protein
LCRNRAESDLFPRFRWDFSPEFRLRLVALAPQGVGKLTYDQLALDGLIGWAAVYAQALLQEPEAQVPPNARPWFHLGDLDALTERLSKVLA